MVRVILNERTIFHALRGYLEVTSFWIKSIAHKIAFINVITADKYRDNDNCVNAKTKRITAPLMLVFAFGLSLEHIDGNIDMLKSNVPTKKTKSCHIQLHL